MIYASRTWESISGQLETLPDPPSTGCSIEETGLQVMMHDADRRLREMMDAALRGEEVTIASEKDPVLRLIPVEGRKFTYGVMADKLKGPVPDFLEPMSEEELQSWEGANERNP